MACNILVSSEEKLLPKSVQELSMDGDEPPSEYIVKEKYFGSEVSSTPIPVPIIDVSLLSSEEELEKLRSALISAGCFQIMSNGIFKSILHRVVTNTEKLRISIAVFNEPEPENEIGPAEGLITEARPRLYRNVKNFGDIIYKSYQEGKIALDTVKIAYENDQK